MAASVSWERIVMGTFGANLLPLTSRAPPQLPINNNIILKLKDSRRVLNLREIPEAQ